MLCNPFRVLDERELSPVVFFRVQRSLFLDEAADTPLDRAGLGDAASRAFSNTGWWPGHKISAPDGQYSTANLLSHVISDNLQILRITLHQNVRCPLPGGAGARDVHVPQIAGPKVPRPR
jgi:hypothetical protein